MVHVAVCHEPIPAAGLPETSTVSGWSYFPIAVTGLTPTGFGGYNQRIFHACFGVSRLTTQWGFSELVS